MQLQIEINDKYAADLGLVGSDEEDVEIRREHQGETFCFTIPKGIKGMVTPNITEDYWMMRVPVSRKQAVVCFEKFGTIGIGFQVEDADWNTNDSWIFDAEEIYDHIKVNKGQKHITRQKCVSAIKLLQGCIAAYLEKGEGTVEH